MGGWAWARGGGFGVRPPRAHLEGISSNCTRIGGPRAARERLYLPPALDYVGAGLGGALAPEAPGSGAIRDCRFGAEVFISRLASSRCWCHRSIGVGKTWLEPICIQTGDSDETDVELTTG